jgi:UDP-N-acetyl-2-amino-2-deoxyglucuronate dehydrogenase
MSINLGIIGCGLISHRHAAGLSLLRNKNIRKINLQAVCSTTIEKAQKLAEEIGSFQGKKPKVYTNYETMLEKEPSLDAVDICTDHRSHHNIAVSCLEAGKHAIVEKPLGITMRACRLMNETAYRKNRILATAENLRRAALNRAIKWAIDQGMIGEPRFTIWQELTYDLGVVDGTPWRHDKFRAGGGWVLDVGSHIGDLLLYNLGDIDEVYAAVKSLEPVRYLDWPEKKKPIDCTVEDTSMAVFKFNNGVLGQWTWTKSAPGEGLLHRAIYGTRGSVDWQHGLDITAINGSYKHNVLELQKLTNMMLSNLSEESKEKFFPKGLGSEYKASFWGGDPSFAIELLDFAEAILNQGRPEVNGILGAKAMAVPMAIFESSWLGEPVKISDVENCKIENYQAEINEALGIE